MQVESWAIFGFGDVLRKDAWVGCQPIPCDLFATVVLYLFWYWSTLVFVIDGTDQLRILPSQQPPLISGEGNIDKGCTLKPIAMNWIRLGLLCHAEQSTQNLTGHQAENNGLRVTNTLFLLVY